MTNEFRNHFQDDLDIMQQEQTVNFVQRKGKRATEMVERQRSNQFYIVVFNSSNRFCQFSFNCKLIKFCTTNQNEIFRIQPIKKYKSQIL